MGEEDIESVGRRALDRAKAMGVREFALERSFGEFDYLGKPKQDLSYNGAEILKEIISLKLD